MLFDVGAYAVNFVPHARRRRTPTNAAAGHGPGAPAPPAPAPAITPVPGTAAAQAAAEQLERASAARPHVLLDPHLASRPEVGKVKPPAGMPANEIADRIVGRLLEGSGPIVLCVPGTLGGAFETSMLAIARGVVQQTDGPISVASIPYPNGIPEIATRVLGIGTKPAGNVLSMVLHKLHDLAPGRPVLLAGESQGAWLIADTLRMEPQLAATVTRVAMFAKPGFVQLPPAVGQARDGAGLLGGAPGILEWRHVDDIVPSLFGGLGPAVAQGYVDAFREKKRTGQFEYPPHHYDFHGVEGARWLLLGELPAAPTTHLSKSHPVHAAAL